MQQLSTLNTTGPIDYDNLNIVTRPRPPRRRQSGISLVPFRPYVKCLTGVREPFLFTNGRDPLMIMGKQEEIFKQNNARCIGSLLADCDISDVIRWDIAGDSTRLPMMCKLWMIVDGAVVERGKPHLVQDAAIQVFIGGRNYRSILSAEQRYNKTSIRTFDRRRRQSWHDLNEYHSVPYYQYTRCVYSGYQKYVQCDMDDEHLISQQITLSFIDELLEENQSRSIEEHHAHETVHNQSILQDRVQISIMTQTEFQMVDNFTSIDSQFIEMFNLNLQTNENLLSYIVNPYKRAFSKNYSWSTTTVLRNGVEYANQSVSTGDNYPLWWLQLSTNVILSDRITNQGEKKEITIPFLSPRQLEQSVQTEPDKSITSSPRIQKSSSSVTLSNHYEVINEINDGNNARRCLPFFDDRQRIDSHGDVDSHLSYYQIETSSNHDHERIRRRTSSSKISETDYNTFALALNQQSYSTPDRRPLQLSSRSSTNEIKRKIRTESTSTTLLATLLERYEKSLQERQRAIAIVNDELLDINDVLKHYRDKIYTKEPTQSNTAMELYQDLSALSSESKEEHPSSSSYVTSLTKTKYRLMPSLTSEEMLQAYIPSPRLLVTHSPRNSPRIRQPRFDYYDLSIIDNNSSSAWIRYNEQRIDELQKRIDLMLQIDDNEEAQLLLSTINPITHTVTQRIDDILMRRRSKRRNETTYYHDRILSPRRYNFRLPYRLNQSLQSSPRSLTRNVSRSSTPISKSVRISTDDHLIPNQIRPRETTPSKSSVSRPIVSILRRNKTPRSRRLVEAAHTWKNESDGKVYILEQFSIPRYYRLYNDVSFREVYNFSRILEKYVDQNGTTSEGYSSMIRNFALDQQLPTITSIA